MRAAGESCSSAGANHVDRRPSAFRTWFPVNVTCVSSADEATKLFTRPEAPVSDRHARDRLRQLQLLRDRLRVVEHRAPVVVRRERVVGIRDRDEVRHVDAGRLERRDGAAARRREEERVRDLAVVEDDLSLRRVDGGARGVRLGRDAAVHLAARVPVEVVRTALRQVRERVRARGDRLRFERGGRPLRRHLGRDDALQVLLEADRVDDVDQPAVEREGELAAVRRSRRRTTGAFAVILSGGSSALPSTVNVESSVERSRVERRLRAGRIDDRPRRRRRERHLLLRRDENPHRRDARLPERRPRVVVGEDLVVGEAVQRVAVRTPLAEADAVPPAVPGERDDRRRGARRRGGRRRGRRRRGGARGRGGGVGARREQRCSGGTAQEQRGRAGQKGEPTHADHGSRGASEPRQGFTERFHRAARGYTMLSLPV